MCSVDARSEGQPSRPPTNKIRWIECRGTHCSGSATGLSSRVAHLPASIVVRACALRRSGATARSVTRPLDRALGGEPVEPQARGALSPSLEFPRDPEALEGSKGVFRGEPDEIQTTRLPEPCGGQARYERRFNGGLSEEKRMTVEGRNVVTEP